MTEDDLYTAALAVREHAYTPYSGFKVGAALRASNGKLYSGVNVENAAYGSTVCAERNAIFQMVAAGAGQPLAMYVVTDVSADHLSTPCGACCQVMVEFNPNLPITLANLQGDELATSLDRLYPAPFTARQLEEK